MVMDRWQDEERRVYIMELFNRIVCQSDSANNLAACAMVTHAYLQTGDQKYKQWVSPVHNDLAQPSQQGVDSQALGWTSEWARDRLLWSTPWPTP